MTSTLFELRGRVRDVKPNCSGDQAQGFINRRIRNVIDKRTWTDTLRIGQILIPNAYHAGDVTLTLGSNLILGNGTGWPVLDVIDTMLANSPITELGYNQNIVPASMAGIQVGMYLVIEPEVPGNREVVQVMALAGDRFTAFVRKTHDPNVRVQSSSLAGFQFNSNNYVYTVEAVFDPTTLQVDQAWGSATVTAQSYQILLAYATITPYTKRLLYCWDPVAGDSVAVDKTWDVLNAMDPQRSSTGDPNDLVSMPPKAPSGIMQYEIWPWQTVARGLNVVTAERWPLLVYDSDISPYFINPEILIAGACADALRSKVIPRDGRVDPYYDLDASQYWENEFRTLLEEGEQADEGRRLAGIQNYQLQAQVMTGLLQGNWARTHAVPAWTGWSFGS